ncbi:adhesion G protein-coupled receptor A1 [Pteropus vampyrus]|uniref:Adhesion G protein-coupled receptor A1 n=1 Tax=Pteropus vampyrus TaxID=132908 RepID=A0A6P3QW69_PTEVA|nr:adhesion G protein-coupled receptor A1 [Pteropus vampyrus]
MAEAMDRFRDDADFSPPVEASTHELMDPSFVASSEARRSLEKARRGSEKLGSSEEPNSGHRDFTKWKQVSGALRKKSSCLLIEGCEDRDTGSQSPTALLARCSLPCVARSPCSARCGVFREGAEFSDSVPELPAGAIVEHTGLLGQGCDLSDGSVQRSEAGHLRVPGFPTQQDLKTVLPLPQHPGELLHPVVYACTAVMLLCLLTSVVTYLVHQRPHANGDAPRRVPHPCKTASLQATQSHVSCLSPATPCCAKMHCEQLAEDATHAHVHAEGDLGPGPHLHRCLQGRTKPPYFSQHRAAAAEREYAYHIPSSLDGSLRSSRTDSPPSSLEGPAGPHALACCAQGDPFPLVSQPEGGDASPTLYGCPPRPGREAARGPAHFEMLRRTQSLPSGGPGQNGLLQGTVPYGADSTGNIRTGPWRNETTV